MQGVRSLGKKGGTPGAAFPLPELLTSAVWMPWPVPAPGRPGTRGPEGPQDSGSGSIRSVAAAAAPGLPYLARPALAWRKTERSEPGARGSSSR